MSPLSRFIRATPLPCIVNNAVFKPALAKTYNLRDPHNPSETLFAVSSITTEDVPRVVQSAAKAQKLWQKSSLAERRAIFNKAANVLEENLDDLAALEEAETTSTKIWSQMEWGIAKDNLRETANVVTAALRGWTHHDAGVRAYCERVPFGVVLGMAPWNSPGNLGMRSVAAAIMGGNSAILRTSEYSPRTHLAIGEIFAEAGLPEGVLNVVHVAPEDMPQVTEDFIASREVGKINFTGSTGVGAKIAQVAGKHLVPSAMELGGKAPLIVLPGADLQLTVNNVIFGYTWHSGQICMATNNVLVHESIADDFVAALRKATEDLTASPESPMRRGLFSQASADRARGLLKDALDKGASLVTGKAQSEGSNVVQPSVVDNLSKDMRMYSEEHFAPFVNIIRYKTEEEAIEIANRTEFGLAAAVYGPEEAAFNVMKHLEAGQVHCNGSTIHDIQQLPHGGHKKSGWGRFNGVEGIHEFTQQRVYTFNTPHEYPV